MTREEFINEWDNVDKMKIFEIEDGQGNFTVYDLFIKDNKFYANNVSIDIDYDFSIDNHLEALYEAVLSDLHNN